MSYLEEVLPEFRKGAKIRRNFWGKKEYLFNKKNTVRTHDGAFFELDSDDLMADDWEFYQEPELDWDYIIKNKCLCWFWDNSDNLTLGYLESTDIEDDDFKYYRENGEWWINCRPVSRDEVTFYEDRKDEQ